MTRKLAPLAPYLLGLFFVLRLVANSQGEVIRPHDLLLPITASLLVAGVTHLGAWYRTHDGVRSALIAWVAVLGFASFGIAVGTTGMIGTIGPSPVELALLVLFGIAGGALTLVIGRIARPLGGVLAYLVVVTCLLIGWNGLQVTRLDASAAEPQYALRPSGVHARPVADSAPDVFLLILDKYTGSRTLAAQYGFDNSEFEAFLRDRGFLVPSEPRANYVQTFLALAAFLNLEYLDSLIERTGADSPDRTLHYAAIEANRLAAFFRERGYEFVFLPTAYAATHQNRFADRQIPNPSEIRPEFVTAWYQTTPLPTLQRVLCVTVGCSLPMPYVPESASMLDWKFEQLARLHRQGRPLFVLAHLTVPHEPYLYLADCHHRPPYWPNRDDGDEAPAVRKAYLDQVRCLNRKLETLIAAWQDRATVPPVILLQSDHGHGLGGRHVQPLEALSPAQLADRISVFAAYSVPGADSAVLPDTVTPVNAMRFVLRSAFAADLPPLADATYWSSFEQPNRVTRVR